jgi:hypothetical protein
METNKIVCRENFPGYSGHIPLKFEVVGMTIGGTNNHIQKVANGEPPYEQTIKNIPYDDYSTYNKDYFNYDFSKEYKLEEDKIYSNKSKEADTWIGGSKYKIYPQHIPGYKSHVPGIYSSNIHGMGYSKSTAIAIKGEYPKGIDVTPEEKYKSTTNLYYSKPKTKIDDCKIYINIFYSK